MTYITSSDWLFTCVARFLYKRVRGEARVREIGNESERSRNARRELSYNMTGICRTCRFELSIQTHMNMNLNTLVKVHLDQRICG